MSTTSDNLTWQEIEEYGECLQNLPLGSSFLTVVATERGNSWENTVGKVEFKGIGSVTVDITRGGKPERVIWAPETRVIPIDQA